MISWRAYRHVSIRLYCISGHHYRRLRVHRGGGEAGGREVEGGHGRPRCAAFSVIPARFVQSPDIEL